jgi:DtxR family manganese transport transcriptional regulator
VRTSATPSGVHTFTQARQDHATETAADYAELIYDLRERTGEARGADICKILGVSHVTVSKTLQRLARDGYVVAKPYRSVFLTPKGEQLAHASRERHRLVVALLRHIGVPEQIAEADAEGMEHHVSGQTLDAVKAYLRMESS